MTRDNIKVVVLSCGSQSDRSLIETLKGLGEVVVVGEATDLESSRALLKSSMPDMVIVIMDGSVTGCLKLVAKITRLHDVPVLVVSSRDEHLYAERALRAGARGYLRADASPQVLMGALHTVHQGDVYLSDEMRSKLLKGLTR